MATKPRVDTPSDSSKLSLSKPFQSLLLLRAHIACIGLAAMLLGLSGFSALAAPRFVPGRILIKPKASVSETNFAGKLKRHGASQRGMVRKLNVRVVSVDEASADALLATLRNDPDIEFAERDFIAQAAYLPNDPLVTSGSEWHLAQIAAPQAWDFTTGTKSTLVAVLDSGIAALQPDLVNQIVPGYDFVNGDSDPTDDFGHGTAVAGTIAAAGNNSTGVAGIAFGCGILPVKVVDSAGFGSYSCIAQGIKYAVDRGARVINLSIAGSSSSITLQEAIDYAWSNNVVIVASAGNNGNNALQYPAACDHVVAVSATEPDDTLAPFSNYGFYVTLAAPGDDIWTTHRSTNTPYASWRGTSFSSPIVAGVAALVASANPTLSNAKIVSLLESTADDVGAPGYDTSFGFGRVNAFRAVAAASLEPGALPPAMPPQSGSENPTQLNSDTNAPSLTLLESPKNNARLLTPEVVLAGSAGDDTAVRQVEVQLNGATQLAFGTTNWNLQIALAPGQNAIRIRSVDLAGNVSAETVRTLTYVLTLPVSIETNGLGSFSPNLNGRLLEVGKSYTVRAVPGPSQAFAGWNGSESENATLTFTMSPGLKLVANFVPSPFPAVKGSYSGLLANTNGVMPDSSGSFSLMLTSGGMFSGKLAVGGTRSGFRGQFDLNGNATVTVNRPKATALNLKLHVDLTNGSDQISGYLTDGAWVAEVSGDRNVFNSRFNPAQQAGQYTFVLEQAENSVAAATGSSVIGTSGSARVKGRLSDGRVFSTGSRLAKNGDCPLYLSLSRGSEAVIGWLNFPASPAPTASGTVVWVQTGTNAFAATLQATAVR